MTVTMKILMTEEAAESLQELAYQQGEDLAETVRKAFSLYRLYVDLPADERLCVQNTQTGVVTPLRFEERA
jgi:hypothetical protein